MYSRITTAAAVMASIGLSMLSESGHSQSLVTKVKCADAAAWQYGIGVYRNASAYNSTATVQVVRDTCRPKSDGGSFSAHVTDYDGASSYANRQMPREGRNTWAVRDTVGDGQVMRIKFSAPAGGKVSGTFDYVLILD